MATPQEAQMRLNPLPSVSPVSGTTSLHGQTIHASPSSSSTTASPARTGALADLASARRRDSGELDVAHTRKRMRVGSSHPRKPDIHNAAAAILVRGFRRHIADQAFDHMFLAGSIWVEYQDALTIKGLLKPDEPLTIPRLSSINLSALRKRLAPLDVPERRFLERFLKQDFVATHFTNASLDQPSKSGENLLSVFSRDKLIAREIGFNQTNTTEGDLSQKGDSDYVFFALECTAQPSKSSSRFGAQVYRVPFDSSVFQDASWGALDDLLGAVDKDAGSHISDLRDLSVMERAGFSHISERANRDFLEVEAGNDIFMGKDLLTGAGLTVIGKLRTLHKMEGCEKLADELLASGTPEALNAVLNGILRPEIRVPRHFFSRDFEKFTAVDLDKPRRNTI
jgi:hypothetical protein